MRISLKARTVITIVFVLCLGAYITLDCIKLKQSLQFGQMEKRKHLTIVHISD